MAKRSSYHRRGISRFCAVAFVMLAVACDTTHEEGSQRNLEMRSESFAEAIRPLNIQPRFPEHQTVPDDMINTFAASVDTLYRHQQRSALVLRATEAIGLLKHSSTGMDMASQRALGMACMKVLVIPEIIVPVIPDQGVPVISEAIVPP